MSSSRLVAAPPPVTGLTLLHGGSSLALSLLFCPCLVISCFLQQTVVLDCIYESLNLTPSEKRSSGENNLGNITGNSALSDGDMNDRK